MEVASFSLPLQIIMFIFGVTNILGITLYPILFNFWIIPKIEKKLGKKLEYRLLIYRQNYWIGRWGSYVEISQYIFLKYMGWKWELSPRRALVIAKYPIEKASKSEVVLSFFAYTNILMWCICALVGSIWLHFYNR